MLNPAIHKSRPLSSPFNSADFVNWIDESYIWALNPSIALDLDSGEIKWWHSKITPHRVRIFKNISYA